jgi:hypothetical protein
VERGLEEVAERVERGLAAAAEGGVGSGHARQDRNRF